MADVRGTTVGCNDSCGCPVPCPGGVACRCTRSEALGGDEHKKCPCGEHCSCNPCTCGKTSVTATGRNFCTCGAGCTCATCAA